MQFLLLKGFQVTFRQNTQTRTSNATRGVNRAEEPGQFSEKPRSKGTFEEWDSNKILQKSSFQESALFTNKNKQWKGHILREKYQDRIHDKVISLEFLWDRQKSSDYHVCTQAIMETPIEGSMGKGISFCSHIHFALCTGHHLPIHFPLFLITPLKGGASEYESPTSGSFFFDRWELHMWVKTH